MVATTLAAFLKLLLNSLLLMILACALRAARLFLVLRRRRFGFRELITRFCLLRLNGFSLLIGLALILRLCRIVIGSFWVVDLGWLCIIMVVFALFLRRVGGLLNLRRSMLRSVLARATVVCTLRFGIRRVRFGRLLRVRKLVIRLMLMIGKDRLKYILARRLLKVLS